MEAKAEGHMLDMQTCVLIVICVQIMMCMYCMYIPCHVGRAAASHMPGEGEQVEERTSTSCLARSSSANVIGALKPPKVDFTILMNKIGT